MMAKNSAAGGSKLNARYVTKPRRRRLTGGKLITYAGVTILFVAIAALLVTISRNNAMGDGHGGGAQAMSGPAPDFTLPTVGGKEISLASYRGQKNVLLFFNEGYGCAPCWQQALDIQRRNADLQAADTEFLDIMVDPPSLLKSEVSRWGLKMPVLTDTDTLVSNSYRTLGFGMHAEKPNHTFVFIDKAGDIRWWEDYPSMRAPTDEVIQKVQALAAAEQAPAGTN
jgi:peroxiredoxin